MKTRKRRNVDVHLQLQSTPVHFSNVKNTYQKGSLFCVMCDDGTVSKFPIAHIFRVKEYA